MHNADSTFFALLQDNPAYRFAFIGLALALAIAVFLLLTRKLKAMHLAENSSLQQDDDTFAVSEEALMQAFPAHLRPAFTKTSTNKEPLPTTKPVVETVKPVITVFEAPKHIPQSVVAERRTAPQPVTKKTAVATPRYDDNTVPVKTHSAAQGDTQRTYNGTAIQAKPVPIGYEDFSIKQNNAVAANEISAILNSLTDLIFEFNEAKICLNVWYNKARTLMIDVNSFIGKTVTENIGAKNAAEMNQALDTVIRTQVPTQVEFLSFHGSSKWFLAKFNPVFDANGRYTGHITAAVSDITEQKKASAEIKEKQQQLIEAQKIARIGSWWYDLASRETYWSENLFDLLDTGRLPHGVSHFEYYARLVHPEDRRSVYQYFANIATGTLPEMEHRIITPRGNTRNFNILLGEPVRNESGEVIRVTGIIKDITDTRQADRIIKKSQAELLEAQTIAKIGNWKWYFQYKTLSWSDEVYHIHEEPVLSRMQRGISHFKLLLKYVHPDDKNILLDFLKDPANLRRTSYEYRIITPSGSVKHLSIIIGKVRYNENGTVRNVVGTLQDVTERKNAELYVQQTEDNYKQVLERIKLAAITLNAAGTIVFCNNYFANLLGYSQQSMVGLSFFEHFVPGGLKDMFNDWLTKGQFKSNNVNPVICANGEQRIISWQNTLVHDEHGRLKQVTSIGEDVTDQQKDRQNLISAKEEAERSSSFKTEFLSFMSHEIRTPMNAVIGTTNLLLDENPREDQLPYLKNLKFSGENLLGIIDEILDYNKIEAGKLELSKNPLNLQLLVANIRQSFHARANEKKIGLFTDVDTRIPVELLGDPIRLGQILNNLISNAIKFTSQGGVTISLKERRHTDTHSSIQFTISDTGIGIAPENLGRIFEPFVQERHHNNYGGSGLGLAIVKQLVGLHKAEITAKSILNEGTQFSFTIDFEHAGQVQAKLPTVVEPLIAVPEIKPTPVANGTTTNGHLTHANNGTNGAHVDSNGVYVNGTNGVNAIGGIDNETPLNNDAAPSNPINGIDKNGSNEVTTNGVNGIAANGSKETASNNDAAALNVNVNGTSHTNGNAQNGSVNKSAPIQKESAAKTSEPQSPYFDLDDMKILVVDDNKMNILIANRFLHKWKVTTHEAGNGLHAVEMVKANYYDLVIMDLQMPIMDGFEATRLIKETHPQLPVIALTADAMPETFVKSRNAGMDDYLTKPFMPEMLFEKISKYYNNNLVEA